MPLERTRILLVDDSEDMVEMLRLLLEQEGALVSTAESGFEALELLNTHSADLIVTDISMPGMNGHELLQEVRERPKWQNVPAIALTGLGEDENNSQNKDLSFSAYVMKPVDLNELISIIISLLSKKDERLSGSC